MERREKHRTILVVGAPGSGKGTQGRILGNIPGFHHLACGDVFRSLDPGSELGKVFLAYSGKGRLVPDQFTVQLWLDHIRGAIHNGGFRPDEEVLVLDGIPRNLRQAEMMADYIDLNLLIYLDIADDDVLVERALRRALRENRLDDASEAVIRRRLREFERETAPLLEYYPVEVIRKVDGEQKPVDVLHDVIGIIQEADTVADF
ncbi:MAG: nucleoside monophosphate kinase [Gemmatimonadetes bacterium]|nr:nucleoside monophosphate kinase [Gemmatimonadota bacterium]MDE3257028.1 nucleoside monophosphate kinase [Gemmatimonadota bacterium]